MEIIRSLYVSSQKSGAMEMYEMTPVEITKQQIKTRKVAVAVLQSGLNIQRQPQYLTD